MQKKGSKAVNNFIASLKEGIEKIYFTDNRNLDMHLGVGIMRYNDGQIELIQKHLIQHFLKEIGLDQKR